MAVWYRIDHDTKRLGEISEFDALQTAHCFGWNVGQMEREGRYGCGLVGLTLAREDKVTLRELRDNEEAREAAKLLEAIYADAR